MISPAGRARASPADGSDSCWPRASPLGERMVASRIDGASTTRAPVGA